MPYAVAIAQQLDCPIQLLGLLPCLSLVEYLRHLRVLPPPHTATLRLTKWLIELARSEIPPGFRGGITLHLGEIAEGILKAGKSGETDLLMMSVPGESLSQNQLPSGVVQRILNALPCPILTWREDWLRTRRSGSPGFQCANILVPCDLSESSHRLIKWVSGFADQMRARITVVYAPALTSNRGAGVPGQEAPSPNELQAQLGQWTSLGGSVPVYADLSTRWRGLNAVGLARMIVHTGSDLLVLGTRRPSWWQCLRSQQNAERLVRFAPCPVLTLPERIWMSPPPTEDKPSVGGRRLGGTSA